MTIALNASFINSYYRSIDGNFIFQCFSKLSQKYPQHQFVYIFDSSIDKSHITSKNIIPVITGVQPKNPLLLQYRLNYKVPAILRKYKVDVLICSGGYCSLKTKVPQCIIVNDLSFLNHPKNLDKSWIRFYKNNNTKFLNKAKAIITSLLFIKNEIIEYSNIQTDKIFSPFYCVDEIFKPLNWQQKDNTREKYTEGKEYFLFSGSIDNQSNLVTLLKAFSFFKKRQKSNMQLVLASKTIITDKEFIKNLASYKYRHEVKLFENMPAVNLSKITAAAYALVYPSIFEDAALSPAEAMQSDVPVITSMAKSILEICGDAALYVNPNDFNDIADKMMLIFKDENKRNEHIILGRLQADLFNWNNSVDLVWEAILRCSDQ